MATHATTAGLHVLPRTSLAADLSGALATVRERPFLIVLGMLGFCLRGGIVVLTLPIVMLPTQVEVRLAIGGNLGSTGLSGGFFVFIALATAVTLAASVGALYVLARLEAASFASFAPRRLDARRRRILRARLFAVQALALLAILIASVPLAAALGEQTLSEIVRPSGAGPIYVRVLSRVTVQLVALIAATVGIEAIAATMTRAVLFRAYDIPRTRFHPMRMLCVAAIGWALSVGAVAIGVGALVLAWDGVRSVFLSTGLSGGFQNVVAGAVVGVLFGAVYAAALALCGFGSALRNGLWTLASLR